MPFAEILELEFRKAGRTVSSVELQQLAVYAGEIEHWNRVVNLTALRGAALARRLIVEPVCVGNHLQMAGIMADVGSGNGSPGIPLAITRQWEAVHLIEPRMKRAAFLRHTVGKIGLKNTFVHRTRIEDMPEGSVTADWIVLQAIDPKEVIKRAVRAIGTATTRVVWITTVEAAPVPSANRMEIPNITSKVWVFGLDQI